MSITRRLNALYIPVYSTSLPYYLFFCLDGRLFIVNRQFMGRLKGFLTSLQLFSISSSHSVAIPLRDLCTSLLLNELLNPALILAESQSRETIRLPIDRNRPTTRASTGRVTDKRHDMKMERVHKKWNWIWNWLAASEMVCERFPSSSVCVCECCNRIHQERNPCGRALGWLNLAKPNHLSCQIFINYRGDT